MSAIAGVLHLDGRPCESAILRAMADALRDRSPDGTFIWSEGCAGLVHGGLVTTPESADEPQPFVDPGSGLAITFDGRLDNRAELLRSLDIATGQGDAIGDAELTLRVYRALDEASVDRLLGDFAFAIWDAPRRRLFCARDAMGIKPFYYRVNGDPIAWASDIGVLASRAGPMPAANEGMAGEYLTVITDKRETLFRDVYRLPPAHMLIASPRGVAVRRYWQPDPDREIRYPRDEDYVEHLSVLIHDAIAARMRTRSPVGVMLSGGVDSSSITGVAARLWRAGRVPCAGVETFSISVPGPKDERPFFEEVGARWKLPAHRFVARLPRPGQFRDETRRFLDVQTFPHSPTVDPLRAHARDRGVRVLLTGVGGDDWLGTSPWAYADLLRRMQLGALAYRLRRDASIDDFSGWPSAAKAALWPLMPSPAKKLIRRALGRDRPPRWVNQEFAARIDLADRLARHEVDIPFRSFEQYDNWHEGTSGAAVHSLEMFDRSAAGFGFEHWHPLFDRRIVEFGLATPATSGGATAARRICCAARWRPTCRRRLRAD